MKIEKIDIDELKKYENNAKKRKNKWSKNEKRR